MVAADTGLKLLDFFFLGGGILYLKRVLPRNETVNLLFFGIFSVRYNVSFTKIIC